MQAATLYHNLHYNNRLQLVDIRVGDSSTDEWNWTRGALVFYYGTTARNGWNAFANSTDNNGNVLRQVNYVPLSGGGNVIPQLDDYNYDALNRITSVSESQQNSSGTWTFNVFTQNFGYDRWGNRTVNCSPCQSGVTGDTFTVDTATNRLTAKNGVGMTYDSAGNQTYDATGNRWFDGENRMYKATQGSVTSHYVYDADGKRVRRIIGSTETWMVYGLDGELVAEYAASGSASSPQKEYGYRGGQMLIVAQTSPLEIRWTVTDHLGTPRMNIMGNGASGGLLNSVKRHDYLPFGEELVAGVGLRSSSSHGYEPPSDGVRQKFTSYERDIDTGLDFAEARYYANAQGRFTGIDPLNPILEYRPQNEKAFHVYLNHPQNWNRFVYVSNQPLALIDPDGRGWKRVDGLDSNGKATFHYEWVDDMNVHDAPFGFYQYVDTQGQVVMLNSTSDGKWHQWAIEVATIDSDWDSHLKNVHTNDNSATPTGHREYRDMKQDLLNAGYKRHWDPLHPGAMNFWTDKSPTLNISVYTSMNFLLEESLSFDVVIRSVCK